MEKKEKVLGVLGEVKDPWMGIDYVAARMAKVSDDGSSVSIELGYPAKNEMDGVRERVQQALAAQGLECEVSVSQKIIAHAVQRTLKVLPNVKNIIAVSSGKGGVGKSTVAANLALALSAEGAKVGMLDADIYGPSQPMMLGALGRPMTNDGQKMNPVETLGLELNSIGFLVDADEPMIWRGPLAAQALTQLLTLSGRGYAAGNGRYPAHAVADGARNGRYRGNNAPGYCLIGCEKRSEDVPEGQCADFGFGGKHVGLYLSAMRAR